MLNIIGLIDRNYNGEYTLLGSLTNLEETFFGKDKEIVYEKTWNGKHYDYVFVEGNNNKFKLIKRIVYGRAK